MEEIKDICKPVGFKSISATLDIKGDGGGKKDFTVIYTNDGVGAGVFTRSSVVSGSVTQSIENLTNPSHRAMVGLSGNANCCTSTELDVAKEVCQLTAAYLGCHMSQVLVATTGKIGKEFPIEKVKEGFAREDWDSSHQAAAEAIMTTDTVSKESTMKGILGGKDYYISAIGKGSGMVNPDMATTINFLTTDAVISKELLQEALSEATKDSFNQLTIDGDMSTNDTVFILSSGKSEAEVSKDDGSYERFLELLTEVMVDISIQIAKDGEGATRFIISHIEGARSIEEARILAKSIVLSSRFKASINALNCYPGRIFAIMGQTGIEVDFSKTEIDYVLDGYTIPMYRGKEINSGEELDKHSDAKTVEIRVNLKDGEEKASAFGCDLSEGYIERVNS